MVKFAAFQRFDVVLVSLDPTLGAEMQKIRPCVVISPDEMNSRIQTLLVAPMTSSIRHFPFRPDIHFQGKDGQIALDQIRGVDKQRCHKKLGKLGSFDADELLKALQGMFAA